MSRLLYDPEAELAALRCAIVEPEAFANHFEPGDFGSERYGAAWQAGKHLREVGRPVTFNALADELQRVGVVEPVSLVNEVFGGSEFPSSLDGYAETIRKWARYRSLIALNGLLMIPGDGGRAPDVDRMEDEMAARLAQRRARRLAADRPEAKTSWTVAELLTASFPEPQWAVPGILPVGLSFLAGRPKIGKSWLALQIAHAVGTGGVALSQRVTAGKVLYLALEDGPRRLKERLIKQDAPCDADIHFETAWRRLTDGGLDDLREAITAERYSLVVLDTLSRALGRADQSDLADMTILMGDLQQLALERDIAILVVDHHRKSAGFVGDPIDDIMGSTAKAAVADAALGLFKEQGKAGATLKVTGRDLEQQELALSWDTVTCCWQNEGTVEDVALRGRKSQVLDVLRDADSLTLTQIAGLTTLDKGNLSHILNDLVTAGRVERLTKNGRDVPYRLAPE